MSFPTEDISPIEALFGDWFACRAGGGDPEFEALCRAHPEHAEGLRAMRRVYELLLECAPAVPGDSTAVRFGGLVEQTYGEPLDPEISLAAAPSGGPAAALVPKLGRHPSARYQLEGELARGGMAAILRVWDHDLRRHLAMKTILERPAREGERKLPTTDARRLVRFLEEAQVTGQLDHPSIVPVHELGIDDEGRLYFTMKLVEGRDLRTIFELVRERREGWSEVRALGVLLKVCEAMSYAHDKGVIHRDLKPANVMVGRYGEVYVMDWGLAKVLGRADDKDIRLRPVEIGPSPSPIGTGPRARADDDPDPPLLTLDGDVIGTPAYMPPEQAEGDLEAMGPHSDVYAVGAMLYHLLVGHAPYARGEGAAKNRDVLQAVRSGPPPSLELETPATAPELVAICERAMAREIGARYRDMGELAADLSACLEGQVVLAYETGTWAETKKWLQRNRPLAASLAAAVLLLCGGLSASLVFKAHADDSARVADERRVEAEGARAEAEAARAEALTEKEAAQRNAGETRLLADFQSQMLSEISVDDLGRTIVAELERDLEQNLRRARTSEEEIARARTALREDLRAVNATSVAQRVLEKTIFGPAERAIEAQYAEKPLLAAMLRSPLANTLRELSLFDLGEKVARSAVEALRAGPGGAHPDTLIAIDRLGVLLRSQGRLAEAEPLLREAREGLRSALGERHLSTVRATNNLANVLQSRGDYRESEELHREALAGYRALLGDEDQETLRSIANLAVVLQDEGRLEEAESLLREVLAARSRQFGDQHPDAMVAQNSLAAVLEMRGRFEEAEELFRRALAGRRARLGDEHLDTLRTAYNLGHLLLGRGAFAEAGTLLHEALAGRRARLGEQHVDTLASLDALAQLYSKQGRLDDAETLLRDVLSGYLETLGETHPDTLTVINNLACLLQRRGRPLEAEPLLRHALEGTRAALGEGHPETLSLLNNLGVVLLGLGQREEALALWREALASAHARLSDGEPQAVLAAQCLATTLVREKRFSEAEPLYQELLSGCRSTLGDAHAETKRIAREFAACYDTWHAATPEAGHDARALELRRLFDL